MIATTICSTKSRGRLLGLLRGRVDRPTSGGSWLLSGGGPAHRAGSLGGRGRTGRSSLNECNVFRGGRESSRAAGRRPGAAKTWPGQVDQERLAQEPVAPDHRARRPRTASRWRPGCCRPGRRTRPRPSDVGLVDPERPAGPAGQAARCSRCRDRPGAAGPPSRPPRTPSASGLAGGPKPGRRGPSKSIGSNSGTPSSATVSRRSIADASSRANRGDSGRRRRERRPGRWPRPGPARSAGPRARPGRRPAG